ncbi:MAG: aminotransferase class I/II-fold pyridoxal phosphate-dependent enzyme [Acidobacteria bacterium]|nr:aminotransferase class I/II-fold pyridoxal phosphate-dependent enzyme [Acidobacteriota bacterium]
MQIPRFELERWQSVWENQVEINISESGVLPLTVAELVPDAAALQRLLSTPLGYPQTNGSEPTRAAVAALYPQASPANVLMTTGCAEANFLAVWALVEPRDEVIFMQPNYLQIGQLAASLGARVHELRLREELAWRFDGDDLRRLVNERTSIIAVCNPNNPTGAVMTEEAMEEVCGCAARVGAWVLADEVYRGAEFSGGLTPTFWNRYERVLCTGGLSKAYSLPGLRTGWVVAPPEMVDRLWSYHDYTTIGISMLSDRLAAIALEPATRRRIRERLQGVLRRNYPLVQEWVAAQAEVVRHIPPVAGAIAWIGYELDIIADELADELRRTQSVLIVPGTQFGPEFNRFIRIGFAGEHLHLQQGLARLSEALAATLSNQGISLADISKF